MMIIIHLRKGCKKKYYLLVKHVTMMMVQALHTAYQETCGDCSETIAKDREEADIIGDNRHANIVCNNIYIVTMQHISYNQ